MNEPAGSENIGSFADGLSNVFNISPWLLVVPLLTGIMISCRLPAVVILFMATLMACIAAMVSQTALVDHIADSHFGTWMNRFRGVMIIVYGNTAIQVFLLLMNWLPHEACRV